MLQASNHLIFTILFTWVLSTPFFRGSGWGQDCFKATNTVSQIKFVGDMGRRKNRLWNNKGRVFHCQFVKIRCVSFCSCLLRTTRIHVHMHTHNPSRWSYSDPPAFSCWLRCDVCWFTQCQTSLRSSRKTLYLKLPNQFSGQNAGPMSRGSPGHSPKAWGTDLLGDRNSTNLL